MSERQALRSSVMGDNRPYPRLLCATIPVIGDTPYSRVAGAHMRKRGNDPPLILGAQTVQPTELRMVGEWPGGLSTLHTSRLLHMLQSTMDNRELRVDCLYNTNSR
jgi:hypothetical protein